MGRSMRVDGPQYIRDRGTYGDGIFNAVALPQVSVPMEPAQP